MNCLYLLFMNRICLLLLFPLLLSSCQEKTEVEPKWSVEEKKDLPFPVSNQAVVEGFIEDEPYVYSFGGLDSTKSYAGIHLRSFRYDVKRDQWKEILALPDTLGKIAHAASRVGDTIYIMGGYHVFKDGSELSSNKVHRYSIHEDRYLPDGAAIPTAIDDHVQTTYLDRYIILVTGWSDRANVPAVQIYDTFLNKWMEGSEVPDDNDYKSFGASGAMLGDTLIYFGGASMGKHFPIQHQLRKGVIQDKNPQNIQWSVEEAKMDQQRLVGYRMASMVRGNRIFWLGGSNQTYNYDGMAYVDKEGVKPNHRLLSYGPQGFHLDRDKKINMDLRGIANICDSIYYIVGGLNEKQQVSPKVYQLKKRK